MDQLVELLVLILTGAIRAGTPVLLVCLGEIVIERSGLVNLGMEGSMLLGALVAFATTSMLGNPWLGVLAGGLAGMIQVTGVEGRLLPTTGVGFGYIGFLAAWIVAQNPLLAILSSIILSLIAVSGDTLQLSAGLPASSVNILTATVVLGVLAVLSARKK